jgi:hypothetical protein
VITWIHDLAIGWLILIAFIGTGVLAVATFFCAMAIATRRGTMRVQLSPGVLSPVGIVFGLVVGFLVVGLWNNVGQARQEVNDEASALRSVVLLAHAFPGPAEIEMDSLIRQHINNAVHREWPLMARQNATLTVVPAALGSALDLAVTLKPSSFGQQIAQRQIVSSLETALDARRQRIILSQSTVNWIKWLAVLTLGLLTLFVSALVHAENRRNAAFSVASFAVAIAVVVVVIASSDRPFTGPFRVSPSALAQVSPPAQ